MNYHEFIDAFNQVYDGWYFNNREELERLYEIAKKWEIPTEQKQPYLDLVNNALSNLDLQRH
jgi:hypothetical protein